jgi:hypothetical protein
MGHFMIACCRLMRCEIAVSPQALAETVRWEQASSRTTGKTDATQPRVCMNHSTVFSLPACPRQVYQLRQSRRMRIQTA